MKKILLLLVLVLAFALVLVGCSKSTTVVDEDGTTVTVDESTDEATITMTDDEGNTATVQGGDNLDLPANWPEGTMPIYPGSSIVYTLDSEGMLMVGIGTNDNKDDVLAFYENKLAGASNTTNMSIEDANYLSGEIDGTMYQVTIGVTTEDDWDMAEDFNTYVTIMIMTY